MWDHPLGFDCPFISPCEKLKKLFNRCLLQLLPHSQIAYLFLKNNGVSLKDRIEEEADQLNSIYKSWVETVFRSYSEDFYEENGEVLPALLPTNTRKPTFLPISAILNSMIDLFPIKKVFIDRTKNARVLFAASDYALFKLTSITYTKLSQINFRDFDASDPAFAGLIRRIHPFIMKKLEEFANSRYYETVNLSSSSLANWLKTAKIIRNPGS